MNRLWVRLTLALVAITLLSVIIVAVLANVTATAQFQQFVSRQDAITQTQLTEALAEHYQTTGGWDGVSELFEKIRPAPPSTSDRPRPNRPGGARGRGPTTYLLADADGRILVDDQRKRLGEMLPGAEMSVALPIEVEAKTVGYLVANSPEQELLLDARQLFLSQLQRNLVFAGLIASAIAVALGALISRAIASPLANLAQAARALSARKWDTRAQPKGTQEIDDVAHAFNNMAESLQQAEVNRRNLTADIAHELRTPLSVIQGNLRAMLDDVYPLERSEIANVYDETRLLSRLIEDLRELALAEAGQIELKPQAIDVSRLLQATADQFAIAADARDVSLTVQPPVVALFAAFADGDRAGQVLRNLINNALRHTPEGGHVSLLASSQGAFVRLSVTDTGEGIAPDDLPLVFDRFYRSDKSRARASGGTGLGLAIAKTLVEAMGGQIGVESQLGQGSTFWFTLPVRS
jgi:two-component system OmpR family sensor kinase/two-component system sensor histidine kinase BaeS